MKKIQETDSDNDKSLSDRLSEESLASVEQHNKFKKIFFSYSF